MKLGLKLTLFNTISKLVIVVLFVLLLPVLIRDINSSYTDSWLRRQQDKVLRQVHQQGINTFIQNGEGYGSYNALLKEEYVSMDVDSTDDNIDTIVNERRLVGGDTIQYRILSHNFKAGSQNYLLEIGRSIDTMNETAKPLQNIAFEILLGMVLLTILADQVYSTYVLRPLGQIIKTKLIGHKFPRPTPYRKVRTSTSDFEYLDISIHKMIQTIESAFQKEREFISNASHELMTPISILQSKIENMFGSEEITDEVKERLLAMQRILNRLKSITKTLLLISQIENDQFLKEDSVSVDELVREVYDEISIRLQEKNINLSINVPADWKLVKVNKFLLFNLFFNLINNAIKYNKKGGSINITGAMESKQYVIDITDTGIGISAEQLPHIFNRFKKFSKSLQQDSFGLGLPIVKSIADFHQVKIEVHSETDKGSTFRLILPAELIENGE
ncbi:MAG TPA: HAMP domain-containing sensor histidine kinase [Mucilaginibacter sp.]|nr:HAMP domain-containing sensor histidine kinase [Mucilaginibacter sp.]